jgi:di/tricarboxylate transporter
MTLQQGLAFGILGVMMLAFAWGKIRYDVVAVAGLFAAIAAGIVPYDKAFSGFSDDIVIIVASALVVSTTVARSGVIERLVRPLGPYLVRTQVQVIVLTATVTVLSALVKNIGALAMMIPVAFQIARRNDTSVSAMLMPMAFGSLLGGIVTLIGTSPNIIVSRIREDMTGEPFGMFDFAPVGAVLAIVGVVFLSFGYRLLPRDRKGQASIDAAFNLEGYTTEAVIPEESAIAGKTVGDLKKGLGGRVYSSHDLAGSAAALPSPPTTSLSPQTTCCCWKASLTSWNGSLVRPSSSSRATITVKRPTPPMMTPG